MVKKFSNLGINALCFFFIIQNCENFIKKGSQDQPKIQIQGLGGTSSIQTNILGGIIALLANECAN